MPWRVEFHDAFAVEFSAFDNEVKIEIAAKILLLQEFGPALSRPHADTLKGSRHANMKELRLRAADGVWRIAFDPERAAILLVAGDKSGVSETRFYRTLIATANARMDEHLAAGKES